MPAGDQADVAGERAVYVYGILPSDVEVTDDAQGVGDPPAEVVLVKHGEIAALVSLIDPNVRLGRSEDLMAHQALLDQVAVAVPVLPVRFGAVVANEDAVIEVLLAPHHDDFVAALAELDGKAQFVIKGRYEMDVFLRQLFSEDRQLGRLRDAIRGKPEAVTQAGRMAIGERVAGAIAARRDADTRELVTALTEFGATVNLREPTHDEDAVHVACLIDLEKQPDLESTVERLAQEWADRVSVRLLGPLAAYDFVVANPQE
ncbi:GvpL/GvpF family gas vesicle protein [Actinophytocola sp.]|uniref:GvpL/GvpF family gas vesicle protein n=1 Tax=Actinophytocola sp. TaxID=1872138 RepID=UPI002ED4DA4E